MNDVIPEKRLNIIELDDGTLQIVDSKKTNK